METKVRFFQWLPRIICMLSLVFISLFALDAFSNKLTIEEQLGDFLIHLIPSFILLAILIIAWKREYIGGILFTIIGLVLTPFIFTLNYNRNHSLSTSFGIVLAITFPIIIVGILFIISHFVKKKSRNI
jgi:hypothetical protein